MQRIIECDGHYYKPTQAETPEFDTVTDKYAMYGYLWLSHEKRYQASPEVHLFSSNWKWVDEKSIP